MILLLFVSVFSIIWANIGYPLSILVLGRFIKKENRKLVDYFPSVTVMVVAHNEEKVIEKKLQNLLALDYSIENLKILVTSDHSDDRTNLIVEDYVHVSVGAHIAGTMTIGSSS